MSNLRTSSKMPKTLNPKKKKKLARWTYSWNDIGQHANILVTMPSYNQHAKIIGRIIELWGKFES